MENYKFIADIFQNLDIFLIIFSRILGFIIIFPIFMGNHIPNISKLSFTVLLSSLVYFNKGYHYNVNYDYNLFNFGFIFIIEFLTGFVMAYTTYLTFSIMYLVGQLIDQTIGFSMVSIFDPVSQIQVPVTGNLLYMLVMIMLIFTGGLYNFIEVIIKSFEILPISEMKLFDNSNLTIYLIELFSKYLYMGLQISMPIVGSLLIIDISLGLLVKAVPQMNIFVVGLPLKLLLGLLLFYFIMPIFSDIYEIIFTQAYESIINIIEDLIKI